MKYLISLFIAVVGAQSAFAQDYDYYGRDKHWYDPLWGTFKYMIDKGGFDMFAALLMLGVIIFVVVMIIKLSYEGVYSWLNYFGVKAKRGQGVVISHSYTKGRNAQVVTPVITPTIIHPVSQPIASGIATGFAITNSYTPPDFSVNISIPLENKSGYLSVREGIYGKLNEGDKVEVAYKIGKLNGELDIICLIGEK